MTQLHIVERKKGEAVKPLATMKLYDAVGPTKAAKLIGTSTTTLYKARSNNHVSKVIELAAESKLKELDMEPALHTNGAAQESVLMLLEAPSDKARIIERLCKALGAKFVEA